MEIIQTTQTISEIAIYVYSLIGMIFISFSTFVFTLSKINNALRLSIGFLFLSTGFYFFNSAGKILTNYYIGFMRSGLINAFIVTILATVLLYVVYKINKENIEHKIDLKK